MYDIEHHFFTTPTVNTQTAENYEQFLEQISIYSHLLIQEFLKKTAGHFGVGVTLCKFEYLKIERNFKRTNACNIM